MGVDPLTLIQSVKEKFLDAGGILLEERGFQVAEVYDDSVQVRLCMPSLVMSDACVLPRGVKDTFFDASAL